MESRTVREKETRLTGREPCEMKIEIEIDIDMEPGVHMRWGFIGLDQRPGDDC